MTLEHRLRGPQAPWQSAGRTYTIITSAANVADAALMARSGATPAGPVDETRLRMVQGLRLLAGAWDDAAPPARALRCMESLGMRAISLDDPDDTSPHDGDERPVSGAKGSYDIALALRTPPTRAALLHRVRVAQQALRPEGTLALATTVTVTGEELHWAPTSGPTLVSDDAESAISLATVRGILTAEGFIARVFGWHAAPSFAELAPVGRALPAPRRLLVIAALGDDADARRIGLRSA